MAGPARPSRRQWVAPRTASHRDAAALQECTEFYGRHAAYLADALACSAEAATAWCGERLSSLRTRDARLTLDLWETEGADALKGLMQ